MTSGPAYTTDVVVIGGGQAGLAVGYYLRRTRLSFVILDAELAPGGAWQHMWGSLRLFSPARWSGLPGWVMSGGGEYYPSRDETVAYLAAYEQRYALPVRRPVWVHDVRHDQDHLVVATDHGTWAARAVVSATGTWGAPVVPTFPGQASFRGEQLHAADYSSPLPFAGQRVLVVGGRNSAAQILAEVSELAETTWVTRREPSFLPDDVDGRFLFDRATARYHAQQAGHPAAGGLQQILGDIVMVPPVRAARERGVLTSVRPFTRFTERGVSWSAGSESRVDAVIWCTGFRPVLNHLRSLDIVDPAGHIAVSGTCSLREPRLWLVGYGDWTGYASATLIGVGRTARATVESIADSLRAADSSR